MKRQAPPSFDLLPGIPSLPASEESECAVLGAALLDSGVVHELRDVLAPEDFYFDRHQRIYAAMLHVAGEGDVVDLRTVQARLELIGQLEAAGGLTYLTGLDLDLPDIGRLDAYVGIVRERALRRRLIGAARASVASALRGDREVDDVAAALERDLRDLQAGIRTDEIPTVAELTDRLLERMEQPQGTEGLLGELRTGVAVWDGAVGGLARGDLIVLGGVTGVGKSVLANQLCLGLAQQGGTALVVNLEMTADQLALRQLATLSQVRFDRLKKGYLGQEEWSRVFAARHRMQSLRLLLHAVPDITLADLVARARRVAGETGLEVLVVDYVQLMSVPGEPTREREVARVSRALKTLAKELAVPVIALSQITLPPGAASDYEPRPSDLRESKALGHDADVVAYVVRPALFSPDPAWTDLAKLVIAKHRNGEPRTVECRWSGATMEFKPLDGSRDVSAGGRPAMRPGTHQPPPRSPLDAPF